MDLRKNVWQTVYQRLPPPTLFVTPRARTHPEREHTQTRLRSLGKCDLAGTDPTQTVYQRLPPPTLFVTPRARTHPEREHTQTRLRSLGKCDLAGTDPTHGKCDLAGTDPTHDLAGTDPPTSRSRLAQPLGQPLIPHLPLLLLGS